MVAPDVKVVRVPGKLVVSLKTNPVAPEVTPVTRTPPVAKNAELRLLFGVSVIVSRTKLRTSNAYNR